MIRATAFLSLAVASSAAYGQDGPLNRFGRALDQTGRNIRSTVETEVARGQITAQEREILHRVGKRIDWDKRLAGSVLTVEVQPGGVVILRGSVLTPVAKLRVVDLTESTTGVTSVVDELAVVQAVKVIETPAAARAIETAPVVEVERPPVVAPATRVIVRP
jgi:osmotically-inducible protein OsmY